MATIYLLDSDTITALSEKNSVAEQNIKAVQQEDEIVTYFIVTAEWELGILTAHGRRRQQEIRTKGDPVLRNLSRVLQSSEEVSLAYAQIAAVARVHGATVVTHDGHFKNVENLASVDWTVPAETERKS